MRQIHPIPPFFEADSQILILGSFPSVQSREKGFYYGHPQNRFWPVLAAVFNASAVPHSIEDKKAFLKENRLALWDVVASCEIAGSSDSSITGVVPNKLAPLLENTAVGQIFLNGKTAEKYFNRYMRPQTRLPSFTLPSTSPANAAWGYARLLEAWKALRQGQRS